jgi:acyl-CoA hydrolase
MRYNMATDDGSPRRADFAPIYHEVVTFKAALNHVGNSSLKSASRSRRVPWSGEIRHARTAYLTFVHLGADLKPRPCPRFTPESPGEKRRWAEAEDRRARRLERVKRLRASIQEGR